MPQETQSTFPPSESVRARMYWGILRQITNDGTLVLKKIKMLFDFQTCNFSSISKHLLPLTSTLGSQLGANTSQLSTATCSEVWWASCSLQWPRRVFLAGVVEVLDLTIFGLPSTPEDLGSSGANNLAPNIRLSCNYREQRVETDEERGTNAKALDAGCTKHTLLVVICYQTKPAVSTSFVVPGHPKRCSSKQQTTLGLKWPWLKNLGSNYRTSNSSNVFLFCVDYFEIFWAIPM